MGQWCFEIAIHIHMQNKVWSSWVAVIWDTLTLMWMHCNDFFRLLEMLNIIGYHANNEWTWWCMHMYSVYAVTHRYNFFLVYCQCCRNFHVIHKYYLYIIYIYWLIYSRQYQCYPFNDVIWSTNNYSKPVITDSPFDPAMWLQISHSAFSHYMETLICVNIDSGNTLLPDGTKPLPEPMLTNHKWGPVEFTGGQFHRKYSRYLSLIRVENYYFEITAESLRANELYIVYSSSV